MRSIRLLLLLPLSLAACSSDSSDTPTAPEQRQSGVGVAASILVAERGFSSSQVTVPVGATVTWTWAGNGDRNITFADGQASPTQRQGAYSRTFISPGTFHYACTQHTGMYGTITVATPSTDAGGNLRQRDTRTPPRGGGVGAGSLP